MAEKEGKVTRDLSTDGPKADRAAAKQAAVAAHDAEALDRLENEGGIAQLVNEDPAINTPADFDQIPEDVVEAGPPDLDPEEGSLGQAPVLTPGVMAPISSQALPNAQRDATMMASENGVFGDAEADAPVAFRAPGRESTGARDAYDLAKLLERRPHWINNLDQLDELERSEGVKDPAPWVKNPVDLLPEAQRYNFYFVGNNGNFLPEDRGRGPGA